MAAVRPAVPLGEGYRMPEESGDMGLGGRSGPGLLLGSMSLTSSSTLSLYIFAHMCN
jgi:hypothetical protein